jgi:hypothetical protein
LATRRSDLEKTPLVACAVLAVVAAGVLLVLEPWDVDSPAPAALAPPSAAGEPDPPASLPSPVVADEAPLPEGLVSEVTSLTVRDVVTVEILVTVIWPAPPGVTPEPAAGLTLEAGATSHRTLAGPGLVKVVTDEQGQARATLPWPAVEAVGPPTRRLVFARSSGEGLLERLVTQRLDEPSTDPLELRLTAQRGMLVEGRLVGADGEPAQGRVQRWTYQPDGSHSQSYADWAGEDGLFAVEILADGTYALHAVGTRRPWRRHEMDSLFELGTAFSGPLDLRLDRSPPFVELVLIGDGVLRGRTVDDDGRSAGGVTLRATLVETVTEGGASKAVPWPPQDVGLGHTSVLGETDQAGEFAFEGLRPGNYLIYATLGSVFQGEERLLTPTPVPSDGTPLVLRVTRPHLAIHVRQADGALPEPAVDVHTFGGRFGSRTLWPSEPGLLVSRTGGPRENDWGGAYLRPEPVGPGEFVLEVEIGDSFDVALIGGSSLDPPQRVVVPPGAGRVDVDVVIPDAGELGTLQIDIRNGAGDYVAGELIVRLVDPDSGMELMQLPWRDKATATLEVPPGRHLLVVEGEPFINSHHGTVFRLRELGAFQSLVDVASGETTTVQATLSQPARLDITLSGAVADADLELVRAEFERWMDPEEIEPGLLDAKARRVSLQLERFGRWPVPVSFAVQVMEGTSGDGLHLLPWLALGSRNTSQPLSPGDYTLVGRLQGGREIRRPVTLVPGETLELSLAFD